MENQEYKRGDVFFVENDEMKKCSPNEQKADRPAVVIQNDKGNLHSPTVIVAYITSRKKKFMPTHVVTMKTRKPSVIMCEQIATVSKERLRQFICHLSEADMQRVDRAVSISLGLSELEEKKNETF